MQLIIKPGDDSFETLLSTYGYRSIWHGHRAAINAAFHEFTGLHFTQRSITAHVKLIEGSIDGSSGGRDFAMELKAFHTPEEQTTVLIHELAHRLLSGNAIEALFIGLIDESTAAEEQIYFKHVLTYLFTSDVVRKVFGEEYAQYFEHYELHISNPTYPKAYRRAMDMSFTERQRVVRAIVAAYMVPPNEWEGHDWYAVPLRDDGEAWLTELAAGSK